MTVGTTAANGSVSERVGNGQHATKSPANGHAAKSDGQAGASKGGRDLLLPVVSTENYSDLQISRIDYMPPQPDVLKGERSRSFRANCKHAHCCISKAQAQHDPPAARFRAAWRVKHECVLPACQRPA